MVIDPALNGDELPIDDREDELSALLQELSAEESEHPADDSATAPELSLVGEPDAAPEALPEQPELTETPASAEAAQAPADAAAVEATAGEADTAVLEAGDTDSADPLQAQEPAAETPAVPDEAAEQTSALLPDAASSAEGAEVVAAGFGAEGRRVSFVPFAVYDLLWLLFAGVLVWELAQLPRSMATYESAVYPLTIYAGLTLTVTGPLLLLGVWIVARQRTSERSGLLTSALLMGSAATMFGVTVWWLALLAVDYVRLGSLF